MLRAAGGGMTQAVADGRYSQVPTSQTVTPTTGQTVSFTDNNVDQILVINPAGALAALTVNLPSNANSRICQVCRVAAMQPIAAVVYANTSVLNANPSLATSDCFAFVKINATTWALQQ